MELVNGFFLEPTVSLSGGEALAKMGIEGLRWQQQVMGGRPRFCWAIDICGAHEQMPQLTAHARARRAGLHPEQPVQASPSSGRESPDGSRIPTLVTGQYSDWSKDGIAQSIRGERTADAGATRRPAKVLCKKAANTPAGAPVLVLGGKGDYSLPPARNEQPSEFLGQWKEFAPDVPLRVFDVERVFRPT